MNMIGFMYSNVTRRAYVFFEELRDALYAEDALKSDQVSDSDKRDIRHQLAISAM